MYLGLSTLQNGDASEWSQTVATHCYALFAVYSCAMLCIAALCLIARLLEITEAQLMTCIICVYFFTVLIVPCKK